MVGVSSFCAASTAKFRGLFASSYKIHGCHPCKIEPKDEDNCVSCLITDCCGPILARPLKLPVRLELANVGTLAVLLIIFAIEPLAIRVGIWHQNIFSSTMGILVDKCPT